MTPLNTDHIEDDDLVLHYYGEVSDAEESRVAVHLAACGACGDAYRRLQRVLTAIDAGARAEAPDGFERTVWARLQPDLDAGPGARRGWRAWLTVSPAHLALASAVALLVIGAFAAGRFLPRADSGPQAASADAVRERILLIDLGDHLDRSQMVLVEVVSADADGTADFSAERERAGQLVAANRLYRQSAATAGEPRLAALLDELERVLVEVAASPDRMNAADLDVMRRRIESRGLLFKVRVVSSEVRERQKGMGTGARS